MKPTLFCLLLPLLLAGCHQPAASPPPAMPPSPVTIAPVEQRPIVEWEEFTGRVEAREMVELRPRVSGYITEVKFQAGELVKQDDVLFLIDPRPFQTRLEGAAAEVARAEAVAQAAKSESDRVTALLSAKAISPEEGESRRALYLQAEAGLAAAKAALHSAELELSHTEVRAPITGRISRALTTTGNYVTNGTTVLTTIVTVDPVYVYTDIDENSLLKLQALRRENQLFTDEKGRVPVELQLSNETDFSRQGHIESFDNRLDAGTGSMILRVEFPNPDGDLTPGLFARVRLPMTARYDALLVDEKSILTDQANKYVLGVDENSLSVYRPVVIGPSIDGKRVIRDGLKAGEKIIVNGQSRLPQPGMPVVAQDAATQASINSTTPAE